MQGHHPQTLTRLLCSLICPEEGRSEHWKAVVLLGPAAARVELMTAALPILADGNGGQLPLRPSPLAWSARLQEEDLYTPPQSGLFLHVLGCPALVDRSRSRGMNRAERVAVNMMAGAGRGFSRCLFEGDQFDLSDPSLDLSLDLLWLDARINLIDLNEAPRDHFFMPPTVEMAYALMHPTRE